MAEQSPIPADLYRLYKEVEAKLKLMLIVEANNKCGG